MKTQNNKTPISTKEQEQRFLSICSNLNICFFKRSDRRHSIQPFDIVSKKELKTGLDLDKHYLHIGWTTGGISGGSCWDDGETDNHYFSTGEPEPNFDELDTTLLNLCPNIGFLQYKQVVNVVKRDEYTETEYYGNCTNYATKSVLLRDLLNKVVELELL